jgi:hypothetical protein
MLELRTVRHLKADKEFLKFLGNTTQLDLKKIDGAILKIKKTNIKTIKPIIIEYKTK